MSLTRDKGKTDRKNIMASDKCEICCDKYNNSSRMRVTCASCSKSVCRDCGKKYILDVDQPACMHCKHPWNREFIQANFSKSFTCGDLKKKREDVLLGIEEAMLPATQHLAALERERRDLEEQQQRTHEELRAAMKRVADLKRQYGSFGNRIWVLQQRIDTGDAGAADDATREERRAFIKHCPADGCNGFLTTQYKCGLCSLRVCAKCLERKTPDEEHTCDPNHVATVEFMMKDTRPCPKCAIPIHKIDGCNQMWCVQCHTAFDWRSGRIETGRVHNPHWYEYQRRMNNGVVPREPGDGNCAGNQERDIPRLTRVPPNKRTLELEQIHRMLVHFRAIEMPAPRGMDDSDMRTLRIRYLLNEISKDNWKRLLQQREKKRDKDTAFRQVYEIVYLGGVDIFNRLILDNDYTSEQATTELETLRVYANTCFVDVCKRFSCKYHISINENFQPRKV